MLHSKLNPSLYFPNCHKLVCHYAWLTTVNPYKGVKHFYETMQDFSKCMNSLHTHTHTYTRMKKQFFIFLTESVLLFIVVAVHIIFYSFYFQLSSLFFIVWTDNANPFTNLFVHSFHFFYLYTVCYFIYFSH